MKLHFEPDLDFQLQAIEAVCDLFKRQEYAQSEFTVLKPTKGGMEATALLSDLGVGNRLLLDGEQILENLQEVQLRNGLPPAPNLESRNFTIEMETGTGKTYVYLRTIFELKKRYGFTKFVIVVPSIAIKEGVFKTLEITKEHFGMLYAGEPYEYFIYDSAKLGQVRQFATSPHIQIMIMTVGAINKKGINVIYDPNEKTGGEKPIDLIRATKPILIVDEPQSVDGGLKGKGKEALDRMAPLCTLRYSATHKNPFHMIYRLDAVEAYQRRLVKQIEVASATAHHDHNTPYIRLLAVRRKKNDIFAEIELDIASKRGEVIRKKVRVWDGDDLEEITERSVYKGYTVGVLNYGQKQIELRYPGASKHLGVGEIYGGVDPTDLARSMIRRTIREHLKKRLRMERKGIKILSLFFIDRVSKYRLYDEQGNSHKGEYALIFEEEFARVAADPEFRELFDNMGPDDLAELAEKVHNGYFSIDKKKVAGKTIEFFKDTKGNSSADEDTYNLIMREKEKLLSLSEPLQFIFSHSALREGWDNPNVFQICTLRDMHSELERRQTIGRGLRLCVNQQGERVRDPSVNILTVVAFESYEEFAKNLQREIEEETGYRFGVIDKSDLMVVHSVDPGGKRTPLSSSDINELWNHLESSGYILPDGTVTDELKSAIANGEVVLPEKFASVANQVVRVLKKAAGKVEVKNADERKAAGLRKAIYLSDGFRELWERIRQKTTYRVNFDVESLIRDSAHRISRQERIRKARLEWNKADIALQKAGVVAEEQKGPDSFYAEKISETAAFLPDLLRELQDRTQLTRKTLLRIVKESGKLHEFETNPQAYLEMVAQQINDAKRHALVSGIKYRDIGEYYAQELFETNELTGYLKNMMQVKKGLYDYVVYDSKTERAFVEALERDTRVKLYAKLPGWFVVPTPLGPYNPDWAVLVDAEEGERLYFVVETKGSKELSDLREKERDKIECGRVHFGELEKGWKNPARYVLAKDWNDVI